MLWRQRKSWRLGRISRRALRREAQVEQGTYEPGTHSREWHEIRAIAERDPIVQAIMHKWDIGIEELRKLYGELIGSGGGQVAGGHYVAASALVFGSTLEYLLASKRDGHGVASVTYRLIQYFEQGEVGPVSPVTMNQAITAYQAGDFANALPALRAHAAAGEGEAALYLAMMYEGGKGVAEDPTEAARCFKVAADAGITLAQFRRGMICYRGIGIEPDPEEAKDRFKAAAQKGHLGSQTGIGMVLEEHGDKVEAAAWLLVAATRGAESSQKLYEHFLPLLTEAQKHDARALAHSFYDEYVAPFAAPHS